MSFLVDIARMGLKKLGHDSKSPAIVRNFYNKSINRAALIGLFGKKFQGAVTIWEGPSLFDGTPIKVVMSCYTQDSTNKKTGPMIQLAILPSERIPYDVFKAKGKAVCGSCKYNGSGCYVRWSNQKGIWKASQKRKMSLELASWVCSGMRVRVGSVGDPAAVPTYVWRALLERVDGHTGYTHSWRSCDPSLRRLFMASCDNKTEMEEARKRGWNVFLVVDPARDEIPQTLLNPLYIQCPADGITKSCFSCMACHGKPSKRARGYVIVEELHGATNTIAQARKARVGA